MAIARPGAGVVALPAVAAPTDVAGVGVGVGVVWPIEGEPPPPVAVLAALVTTRDTAPVAADSWLAVLYAEVL